MTEFLKEYTAVLKVNAVNGSAVAIITLTEVREVMAIMLFLVSIISTAIIIRNNLKKEK